MCYCISLNVHEKCTCVLSLWWIWPIIWLYKKTSLQGLPEETGKITGDQEQKQLMVRYSTGSSEGEVLLIKKKKKKEDFHLKWEKRTEKNSCIYIRWYDLLPFMGTMGKNNLNIGVKIGSNWKEIQLDKMADLHWNVRCHWSGIKNEQNCATLGWVIVPWPRGAWSIHSFKLHLFLAF
jgi:hypothetical protein